MSIEISRKQEDKVRRTLIGAARFFCCLKQDGQDEQDGQDGCRLGIRDKGLEDLNVYSISRNKMTRSDRTLMCPAAGVHARDRPSRYGGRGAFFCSAGACLPRSLPHPGHPVNPGHPASDAINIKVLTDLFSLLHPRSIDIKVLTDL